MISHFSLSLLLFFFIVSMSSCTRQQKYVPDYSTYMSDTELMLNICGKFAFEPDAKKLNKVAAATQLSRVISCTDFNGECDLYGKFLTNSIELSKDGILTPEDRKQLEIILNQLTASIKEGRSKLKYLQK